MATKTVYLNSYEHPYNTSSYGYGRVVNPTNAYTGVSSTTYARVASELYNSSGSMSIDNVYFWFSDIDIPEDSIINSVTIKVKWKQSGTDSHNVPKLNIYASIPYTIKGTIVNSSTTEDVETISTLNVTSAFNTVALLNKAGIEISGLLSAYSSNTSISYNVYIYGAELTVDYTEPSKLSGYANIGGVNKELSGGYVNIGGAWKEISGAYMNVGGTWKEMA